MEIINRTEKLSEAKERIEVLKDMLLLDHLQNQEHIIIKLNTQFEELKKANEDVNNYLNTLLKENQELKAELIELKAEKQKSLKQKNNKE